MVSTLVIDHFNENPILMLVLIVSAEVKRWKPIVGHMKAIRCSLLGYRVCPIFLELSALQSTVLNPTG